MSALFLAVPLAYEVLKWAGALYLLWLAWEAVEPGARSPFEPQQLLIALSAAGIASWFTRNPVWLVVPRYFMGFVLAALGLRLALEERRNV